MTINVEQIDPFSLSSVELEQRGSLPVVSCIYFAISGAEILYIGKSANLQQRWLNHHRINQLKSLDNVIIAWFPVSGLEDLEIQNLEEACIRHFRPNLNETVRPDKFVSHSRNKSLRLPPDIESEIKRLAKLNGRSENGEIVYALHRYIISQ